MHAHIHYLVTVTSVVSLVVVDVQEVAEMEEGKSFGELALMYNAPHHGLSSNEDGPDHLGLWYNVLPEHQMALITSGLCAPVRYNAPRAATITASKGGCTLCESAAGHPHAHAVFLSRCLGPGGSRSVQRTTGCDALRSGPPPGPPAAEHIARRTAGAMTRQTFRKKVNNAAAAKRGMDCHPTRWP